MSGWKADAGFSGKLVAWQKARGRHGLPWQKTRDAYRIWLSEIMLQQTQVATVIPYYGRFLEKFPDVKALAAAQQETVMALWSGLGYYTRARNLYRAAQQVRDEYDGVFPAEPVLLERLPGIGRSTAAAIAVFSSGYRAAILDGNVIRVLSRVFGIDEYAGSQKVKNRLWALAESLLPEREIEAYTQGLMDLGATVCTRARASCADCPFPLDCVAFRTGRVEALPPRKPAKKLPERRTGMLVLLSQGKVLLERRPDSGIWGGLLSLPEVPVDDSGISREQSALVAGRFGRPLQWHALDEFSHAFTHFRLRVSPVLVEMQPAGQLASDGRFGWHALAAAGDAPLPAPVRKLLLDIAGQQDESLL